jgi:hypothetical protein
MIPLCWIPVAYYTSVMKKLKSIHILALAGLLLAIFIVINSMSQPGVQDLEGNFEQVAMYRNENNTGPVIRLYAVTVNDTLWTEMEQYGNFMPHTKYGITKVYFFLEGSPTPANLQPGQPLAPAYAPYCIATYEKDAMSGVAFIKQ